MRIDRRVFLGSSAAAAVGVSACSPAAPQPTPAAAPAAADGTPASITALKPMTDGITPITADERAARIEKAQQLMADNKIDAIYPRGRLEHVLLHRRALGAQRASVRVRHPREGRARHGSAPASRRSARASWSGKAEVRVWQEDESPYRQMAGILKDRGVASGRVGVEERLRFFIYSGVKKEAPGIDFVDAEVITAGCRMFKSPAEIALMQQAIDITIEAFQASFETFSEGMTQDDLRGQHRCGASRARRARRRARSASARSPRSRTAASSRRS